MKTSILIISNQRYSLSYAASLQGYGCEVYDTQTIEAARALLRSIVQPTFIIMDLKHTLVKLAELVQFVRTELGLCQTQFVVIGQDEGERLTAFSQCADYFFVRPLDVRSFVALLEP
jgi:DNA-binding response OmpR family regulator